jgi:hypothetical protein
MPASSRPSVALLAWLLLACCPALFAAEESPTAAASAAFDNELERLARDVARFTASAPNLDADARRIENDRFRLLKRIGDLRSYGRLRGFASAGATGRWTALASALMPLAAKEQKAESATLAMMLDSLETPGKIEGAIRDARTQYLIDYTEVVIYDSDRTYATSGYAFEGRYSLAVPPGSYYVQVLGKDQYFGQLYPSVVCDYVLIHCDLPAATLVTVVESETVAGINFDLLLGAKLSGRLLDATTLQPVQGQVDFNSFEFIYDWVYTDNDGRWEISGLAPGQVYLLAASYGFVNQAWSGRDCGPLINECWTLADPIEVVAEGVTSGLDFHLTRRGTIGGRVVEDHQFAGIADVEVLAYTHSTANGLSYRNRAWTDSAGSFTLQDLEPGDYYVVASHHDYRAEAFDDVEETAFRANPLLGTKVTVTPGGVTSGVHFALQRYGAIEGRILNGDTGQPPNFCTAYLWRADSPQIPAAIDISCANGSFKFDRLEPGQYFLGADDWYDGLAPMILGVGSCNFSAERNLCPLTGATRIMLAQGEVRSGFELRLEKESGLRFQIRSPDSTPADSVKVWLQLVDNREQVVHTQDRYIHPSTSLVEIGSLAPGDYWLMALGAPEAVSQVYPGVPCGRWYCDPHQGQKLTLAAGETRELDEIVVHRMTSYQGCQPSPTAVCLNQGRYRVEAFWLDYLDQTGLAFGTRLTDDSATFTFFSPSNIEMVVKLLNACSRDLGHRFWVFAGGLTNVQVWLRVTDTVTGEMKEYRNPLGTTFAPIIDTATFATCDAAESEGASTAPTSLEEMEAVSTEVAPAPGSCSDNHAGLCLANRRFKVSATYDIGSGDANARHRRISPDAATFYFFNYDNVELLVKVLDACDVYGKFWFFATGLTDVYSTIRVEDTVTGRVQEYGGFDGAFQPIIDIDTFSCN